MATRAIEPSFGLLFGDLLRELHVETFGAAIIMSTYDVMMNFSGLFVGPLLKEFSYRKVAIAGSLLCSLGLALTSPAQSMTHIITTYSVINGKFFLFFSDFENFSLLSDFRTRQQNHSPSFKLHLNHWGNKSVIALNRRYL